MTGKGCRPGVELDLHPLVAKEMPKLLKMLTRCSRQTLFQRFHGFSNGVAHTGQLASRSDCSTVVCWSGDRCVGFGTLAGPAGNVHVGVLVEDVWQRKGVGKRIFSALVDAAHAAHVDELQADVLAEDAFILPLLSQAGHLHVNLAWGAYSVRIDLRARSASPDRVTGTHV